MAVSKSKQNEISRSRKIGLWLLTAVLWVATVGLGFLAFIAFQDIATTAVGYILAGDPEVDVVQARGWVTTTRNVSTMIAGVLWLIMVIGGMEYHFRHVGQRRSWRIFAWTLGIELLLIAISVLIF